MIVPNAVILIRGAPHPDNARKLIDYLLSEETERKLAFADCAQIPLHAGVPVPCIAWAGSVRDARGYFGSSSATP